MDFTFEKCTDNLKSDFRDQNLRRYTCFKELFGKQQGPGELEYGSILPNGEDWRLRRCDAGMGETEYRIFKNEVFFAQFDNRKDADTVMVAMTCPVEGTQSLKNAIVEVLDTGFESSERDMVLVLDRIDAWEKGELRQSVKEPKQ